MCNNGGVDELARCRACRYAQLYYLILTSSLTCTYNQLKVYKSLEGYNHFINGWVTNITVTEMNYNPKAFCLLLWLSTSNGYPCHHLNWVVANLN